MYIEEQFVRSRVQLTAWYLPRPIKEWVKIVEGGIE